MFEWLQSRLSSLDCNEQITELEKMRRELAPKERSEFDEIAGFASIAYFAKRYFPEITRLPFGKHHTAFFNAIPRGERGKKVNFLAPRGSSKSTCMAVIYPIHCIFYKYLYEEFGMPCDNYILILSRTYDNAIDRINDIREAIESNEAFQHLKGDTWAERRSITSNDVLLVPQSRGGKVRGSLFRGYRPSLVISDDLDDRDAIRNPKRLEKDMDWWESDLMQCGDENTNFICVDTVKAVKAIAYGLRHKPGWTTSNFKAIEYPPELKHPRHEALWKEYQKIYCDLAVDPLVRQEKIDEFYEANKAAMNEGVVELWHEKWPYRNIREKEFEHGRPFILREYQNLPVDRAMAWFDMDEAITFETGPHGLLRSDGRFVSWEEISGTTIFLDWAGAGEIREQNCYAAVVTIIWEPVPQRRYDDGTTPPAYGYVYSAKLFRGSRGQQLDAHMKGLFDARAFLAGRASRPDFYLRCEEHVDPTGDMRQNFETVYNQLRTKYRFSESVEYVRRIKRKDDRIAALQSPIENGWLCFSTQLSELYLDQMRTFPNGDFNDGPDATEGAWSNPVVVTSAQHREQRRMWREQVKEEGKPHVFYSYV
jgi:hypothetical protein